MGSKQKSSICTQETTGLMDFTEYASYFVNVLCSFIPDKKKLRNPKFHSSCPFTSPRENNFTGGKGAFSTCHINLVYSRLCTINAYQDNTVNFCQGTSFCLGNELEINACHTEPISTVEMLKIEDH
jgi:hypothetical protein